MANEVKKGTLIMITVLFLVALAYMDNNNNARSGGSGDSTPWKVGATTMSSRRRQVTSSPRTTAATRTTTSSSPLPQFQGGTRELVVGGCCLTPAAPEQIHLSFVDSTRGFKALRVTWTTQNVVSGSSVQWWTSEDEATTVVVVPAQSRTYTEGGWVGMIYSAVMETLPLNSSFTYRVGSPNSPWSKNFTVRTAPENVGQPGGRPLRVAQVADMGTNEPHMGSPSDGTIAHLTSLAQSGSVDFILHVGDISYADARVHRWDRFMRTLEPVAAYVPYMTAVGNHEYPLNFISYRTRFWMPDIVPYLPIQRTHPFWNLGYYNFKVGGTNFVMLDAEAPYHGTRMTENQLQWANLSMQNAAKNRALHATPWTVVCQHRPLYCSNQDEDCGPIAGRMRGWIEQMLFSTKVDLDISGHMHDYERTFPVYKGSVVGNNTTFVSPQAPVYVVNGAAGNEEGNEAEWSADKPWSAFHSVEVGFGIITLGVDESTTTANLKYQFVLSKSGEVLDEFTIVKDWRQ